MISPSFFSGLLLAADNRLFDWNLPKIGVVPLEVIIPLVLGIAGFAGGVAIANSLRQREYGWKVGLIISSLLVSLSVVLLGSFKLGVDLQGGVILVYAVDREATRDLDPDGRYDAWSMDSVLERLRRRLNPDGLKEIVIRPFGKEQIEIVIPEADPSEIKRIKELISTGGALRFMIVANDPVKDSRLIERVEEISTTPGMEAERLERIVRDEEDKPIGHWATAGRDGEDGPFSDPSIIRDVLRDGRTGKLLELEPADKISPEALDAFLKRNNIKQVEVLMAYDPDFDIRGEDLRRAEFAREPSNLRPMITFEMKGEGSNKMGGLTAENLPNPERKLGIVFDNVLLSAPVIRDRISEHGQITGNFTEDEVKFIVDILKSGSMPVVLFKQPISENLIGSILGQDTIVKGTRALTVSLVLILLFMLFYYHFAGVVACGALILNLLMTISIMVLLQAPFTLPGLAGLVLTVGMSVDSNVLIFERIREELARGVGLRMALRNGFDRAIVTIIDSNLTTLLTAVVLYAIGTDQVRGFGTTLILGILTSMFTAIFCSRVIFELGERTRWLKNITMMKLLTNPSIDWCKMFVPATAISVVLIMIGLVATVARGKGLFDIDLVGGTSVTMILDEPMSDGEVRIRIGETLEGVVNRNTNTQVSWSLISMDVAREQPDTVYKVDSSLASIAEFQKLLQEAFRNADGSQGLKTYQMEIGTVKKVEPATTPELKDRPASRGTTPLDAVAPSAAVPAKPTPQASEPAKKAEPAKDEPAKAEPKKAESSQAEPAAEAAKSSDGCQEEPEEEKAADSKKVEAAADVAPPRPPEPTAEQIRAAETPDEPADTKPAETKPAGVKPADAKPAESKPADAKPADAKPADAKPADAKPADAKPADTKMPSPAPATTPAAPPFSVPSTAVPATPPGEQPAAPSVAAGVPVIQTEATLRFPGSPITAESLRDRVQEAAEEVLGERITVRASNPNWDNHDNSSFEEWTVTLPLDVARTQQVLEQVHGQIVNSPVWQTSSEIGGQVSQDTQYKAFTAVLISLLGIAAYVWFRFHQLSWGIASVVSLAHDALIMLGAIAASKWLAPMFGFLLIEEFKIDLPTVAAFLTLIGYSINDTIVIFDRIREVRGKSQEMTAEMINLAVNQTLSRSILTTTTVLIVVVILYFLGGPGIHTFAFSLVVGVIAGSYSTIFIAAPLLLWLMGTKKATPGKPAARQVARTS